MRDRFLSRAALSVVAGVITSGPLAVVFLERVSPQPPWVDAATFAEHYRTIQGLPYLFGFLLLGGFVAFMARAIVRMRAIDEARAVMATIATTAFATLVFINYTLQLAWLPSAVRAGSPFVALVTMVNPTAVCWSFEMFGYAALGIAMSLVAPIFGSRLTRALIGANAVVSLAAAAAAAADAGWLMTPLGLAGYAIWNALVIAIMVVVAVAEHAPPVVQLRRS